MDFLRIFKECCKFIPVCIYRPQNRNCTDLKPNGNGYKTARLPLLNRREYPHLAADCPRKVPGKKSLPDMESNRLLSAITLTVWSNS